MEVKIHLNRLELKHPFGINHGTYQYRDQLMIEIIADGVQGFGETVAIDYYGVKIQDLFEEATKLKEQLKNWDMQGDELSFYHELLKYYPHNHFLRCAFDTAYVDWKRETGSEYVAQFVERYKMKHPPLSSITIGMNDSAALIEKRLAEEWTVYKIKIGKSDRSDLYGEIVDRGKDFGVDANGAYEWGQAQKEYERVREYGGIYAEQLVDKEENRSLEASKGERSPQLPHLADEAVWTMERAKKKSKVYEGLVLKLVKCGGISPVMKLIEWARAEGKFLLAGCMTESSVGINHMRAILPCFDWADLDGAFLISNDERIMELTGRKYPSLRPGGLFQ